MVKYLEIIHENKDDLYNSNITLKNIVKPVNKGWLTPSGKVIIVKHSDFIGYASKYFPDIQEAINEFEELQYEEDEELENTGILPDDDYGWHNLEFYQENEKEIFNTLLLEYVYSNGWGIIEIVKKNGIKHLELKCKRKFEKHLKKFALPLAMLLDIKLHVSIISEKYNFDQHSSDIYIFLYL